MFQKIIKIQIRRSKCDYESKSEYYSSCTNYKSKSEYSGFGGKDSNPDPNPNIRDNTGLKPLAKLLVAPRGVYYLTGSKNDPVGTRILKIDSEAAESVN